MIATKFDSKEFMKDMSNVLEYSFGFLNGVQQGKAQFLTKLGAGIKEILEQYVDSNARVSPETLQHVYEWYRNGSPEARLFDISYRISNVGISFGYQFRQSSTIKEGSTTPFYDKARIMEEGIPVTIVPRKRVLAFEDNGETVFTSRPVTISNPGGNMAQGGLEDTFRSFFERYFSQAFLQSSGLINYLKTPSAYHQNFAKGKRLGRSAGIEAGYRWITKAGELG